MALYMLHGTLHCTIYEAEHLVDELRVTGKAPKFLRQVVEKIEDKVKLGRGPSRLYATIELGKSTVGRTRIVDNDPGNPEWNESFHIYCAHHVSNVTINVKSDDAVGAHVIGKAVIPVIKILSGKPFKETCELFIEGNSKKRGKVRVQLQFTSVERDPSSGSGIPGQNYQGVPFTYFPQRNGCRITLYQDAHMQPGFLPNIFLGRGKLHQETRCWEDVHRAISSAKYLIYIAGWSVNTTIRLVRDQHTGEGESLGELLKKKADEGCKVLLLVWDDRTSNNRASNRAMPNLSIMGTHDEETFNYFKSTNVKCVLCPRIPDTRLSLVQGITVGAMFSHHQKSITVDAEISPYSPHRRIISFVGGIDLCDGRYDDQHHSLFHTLNSVHKDDFYNGCFKGASLSYGGPREPWHDIHAKLEGPTAWDVLTNFEQRWKKQGVQGHLLDISSHSDIVPMTPVIEAFDPETWNAQIFRSIDGASAFGFPTIPDDASNMGLVTGKDQVIEKSIQHAYIHAIRRAKDFIYIENQYFLGSCASWDSMQDAGCDHLIPIELALKIVKKIEAGERFTVYIVIPMWPEGLPDSSSVQPILEWQRKTMEMMYREISQALIAKGMYDAHPKDYLSFFCLGNRESRVPGEYEPVKSVQESIIGEHYRKAQENRRFMIYVHSKMIIADDEYIILGSANINQRSMDGARDSEIAVGAYQPFHTSVNGSPRGHIHGFRMSLWYEHMGVLLDDFLQPSSIQCMRSVNALSEKIWEEFITDGPVMRDLPAHLMSYPVQVKEDGSVSIKEGYQWFPDTKATVLGSKSPLPPVLTT